MPNHHLSPFIQQRVLCFIIRPFFKKNTLCLSLSLFSQTKVSLTGVGFMKPPKADKKSPKHPLMGMG